MDELGRGAFFKHQHIAFQRDARQQWKASSTNRLTVELADGASVSYDPKRVYGVNIYREVSRELASGDRIQFSALNKELGIANRDMGIVTAIEPDRLTVRMDGKEERSVSFNPAEFRQFDHGYAVTSHSSQGLTSNRVLAHFDTDSSRSLINQRLAYVAISRASEDARIYTNDAEIEPPLIAGVVVGDTGTRWA